MPSIHLGAWVLPSIIQVILGTNDLVSVPSVPETLLSDSLGAVAREVGLLYRPFESGVNQHLCTVTHVGGGRALTAGHCVVSWSLAATGGERRGATCEDLRVDFQFRVGRAPHPVKCKEIVWAQLNSSQDFAILDLEIDPSLQAVMPGVSLDITGAGWRIGQAVTLLSHPRGRPLESSGRCALLDATPWGTAPAGALGHDCDSEAVSSGALVLDLETGVALGIHSRGSEGIKNYALGLSYLPPDVLGLLTQPKKVASSQKLTHSFY